jgi:hypothetical protein
VLGQEALDAGHQEPAGRLRFDPAPANDVELDSASRPRLQHDAVNYERTRYTLLVPRTS